MDVEQDLGQEAREGEEKKVASDHGMAMDEEEIPTGAREDGHEGAVSSSHKKN